ncbi:DUF305 domain-containing protein [Nonomuraea angiospora]|uniref:DUF305 domain-containing protein n=1 Tax=Nonomuraea angiospora TaxID=46172 RepID=UPI003429180E
MFTQQSIVKRLSTAAAAGTSALVLLTACGGGGDSSMAGHDMSTTSSAAAPTISTTQPGASFNDADVMFAQMMIPHHQQAVEMAELAETRASDKEIKELAAKIKAAQDPEIETMQGWLQDWGKPMPTDGVNDMQGMDHGMPGMMPAGDMKKLEAAKGAAFDKMFVQMMVSHHNGAIEMAKTEQAQGVNPAAKELAKTIETAQQAEVEQMQKILDRL